MTSKQPLELFNQYFDQLTAQRGCFSVQDRLTLVRELRAAAAAQGTVPISLSQLGRVQVSDPRVQAILNGQEVSLGGVLVGSARRSARQRLAGLGNGPKIGILLAALLLPLLLFAGLLAARPRARPAPPPARTTTPPTTAAPASATPATPGETPRATPYALVLKDGQAQAGRAPEDPVSIEFGSLAFELTRSRLEAGEWRPLLAEWLDGSRLRRVVAVPFTQEVGQAVARLQYGDLLRLRLGSSEVVAYRLVDIARVKRHQIEALSSLSPSLAVVLHGERASERYVLVGEAVQPAAAADPAGWPAAQPTLSFTPPAPVTVVVTDTRVVTNLAAGLQLSIMGCSRVAQIGGRAGRFMVCEVALTALVGGAAYSGQSLAISEYAQVMQAADWWPPAVSAAGAIGDGSLAGGTTVSGKVAGEVAKPGTALHPTSDPVLLWEQAGVRFVIYLEH